LARSRRRHCQCADARATALGRRLGKATEIGYALLLSPLFGFCMAAILLLLLKFIVRNPALYTAPEGGSRRRCGSRHPDCDLHRRQLAHGSTTARRHGLDHADS